MKIDNIQTWAKWLLMKTRKRVRIEVCRRLYQDTNRDIRRSMFLAGTARSGTTWLADIISSQVSCRMVSEPFNPERVLAFSRFADFQYKRPTESDPALCTYASRVLQGDIRDSWIDREVNRIFSRYRLIKEIRANLFLKWLHSLFPDVPLLFVIRHPCAVVLSRMEAKWEADLDLRAFLSQPALIDDFLTNTREVIKNARTVEEKHAIVWSILHLVPSRQFQPGELRIVFYEHLCLQPEKAIDTVFRSLNQPYQVSVFQWMNKPSRTSSRKSAILTGEDRVSRWRKKLSPQQIDNILNIVSAFGLDHLYGDADTPLSETL